MTTASVHVSSPVRPSLLTTGSAVVGADGDGMVDGNVKVDGGVGAWGVDTTDFYKEVNADIEEKQLQK